MIADRTINKVIQQSNRIAKKTDWPKHSNFSVWALSACTLVLPTWSRDTMRRQALNKMTSLLRRHHSKAVSLNMICGTSEASDFFCCYNPVLYLISIIALTGTHLFSSQHIMWSEWTLLINTQRQRAKGRRFDCVVGQSREQKQHLFGVLFPYRVSVYIPVFF